MKPIRDRSDEELNRTIAEWMGWKLTDHKESSFRDPYAMIDAGKRWVSPTGQVLRRCPLFTEDLNACHEAENKWCEQDGPMDANHPRYLLGRTLYNVTVPLIDQPFRATARQRAEALVAVIEQQKGQR